MHLLPPTLVELEIPPAHGFRATFFGDGVDDDNDGEQLSNN
jgi:hypothetical protein